MSVFGVILVRIFPHSEITPNTDIFYAGYFITSLKNLCHMPRDKKTKLKKKKKKKNRNKKKQTHREEDFGLCKRFNTPWFNRVGLRYLCSRQGFRRLNTLWIKLHSKQVLSWIKHPVRFSFKLWRTSKFYLKF